MVINTFSKCATVSIAMVGAVSCSVGAQAAGPELVLNGGFETGDFYGWSWGSNSPPTAGVSDQGPHNGQYSAFLGSPRPYDTLDQGFYTVPGRRYLLSFWLDNAASGPEAASFVGMFGSTTFLTFTNADPSFTFKPFIYELTAVSGFADLQFAGYTGGGVYTLDDISLTLLPIPEPSIWALLLLGAGAMGRQIRKHPTGAALA
jgi:hypothetical protein